jgi:hypothetical protein
MASLNLAARTIRMRPERAGRCPCRRAGQGRCCRPTGQGKFETTRPGYARRGGGLGRAAPKAHKDTHERPPATYVPECLSN